MQAAAAANPQQIEAARARLADLSAQNALLLSPGPAESADTASSAASSEPQPSSPSSSVDSANAKEVVLPAVEAADTVAGRLQQVLISVPATNAEWIRWRALINHLKAGSMLRN